MINQLKFLFPNLTPEIDYSVSSSGGVLKLIWLNQSVSKPTQTDIDDVKDEADLYFRKSISLALVKQATAKQREKYASNTVGKANAYASKALEAYTHYNNGSYDGSIGGYMQARINETGETAQFIADEWRLKSQAWQETALSVNPFLEAKEDKARIDIEAATTVNEVETITNSIIASIEQV